MTIITIKIDKRTKAGKAFLAMSESFFKGVEGIEIVETEAKKIAKEDGTSDSELAKQSPYDPEFVKMVLDAQKRGKYTTLDPNDIWGSLGLK